MKGRGPLLVTILLVGVLALWLGAAGARASTWLGAGPLDPGAEPTSPSPPAAAANAGGLVIAGWVTRAREADGTDGAIRVRERRRGQPWGSVTTLYTPPDSQFNYNVRIAVGDAGFAIATWEQSGVTGFAARNPAGSWGPAQTLPGGMLPTPVALADGTGLIEWVSADGKTLRAARVATNGTASAPFDVFTVPTPAALIEAGAITVAEGSGDVLAAAAWRDGSALHLAVRRIFPDDSVSEFVCGFTTGAVDATIGIGGTGPQFTDLAVVADGAGGIVAAFALATDIGTSAPKTQVTVASCRATVPGWAQRIATPAAPFPRPALGLHAGRAVAAWVGPDGIVAITRDLRSGASDWSAPATAIPFAALNAPPGADAALGAGVDAGGTFVLPAVVRRAGELVFTSAHGTGAPPWTLDSLEVQPAADLTSAYAPAVAPIQAGGFVSVWRNQLGDRYARTADLDVAPPAISVSGIPARTVAGTPVAAQAAGQDDFSGFDPSTIAWTVGGAGAATGTPVTLTFTAAGRRTIQVTGRDRAGNAGAASVVTDVVLPDVPLKRVSLTSRWRASTLTGRIRVTLSRTVGAPLRVTVRPAGRTRAIARGTIRAGRTSVTILLPRFVDPGRLTVAIDGTRNGAPFATALRTVRLPAPVEGVGRGFVSVIRGANTAGTAQASGRHLRLWAYLRLAVRPKGPVSATWYPPGRPAVAPIIKQPRAVMEFTISSRTPLATGTWRVVFRSRGRVIATARITLQP